MNRKNNISFEEALIGLEQSAEALRREDTTLEEAMRLFEEGMKYYEYCSDLLKAAKQKIQVYDRNKEGLRDF